MTETVDWLEWAEDVTDSADRADLARWAVSLRRARANRTPQTTGKLTGRSWSGDLVEDGSIPLAITGHCCLGIWCQVKLADGTLTAKPAHAQVIYSSGEDHLPQGSTLPQAVRLAGSNDPDLLAFLDREDSGEGSLVELAEEHGYMRADDQGTPDVEQYVRYDRKIATAAELNDDHGLDFGQIADVVIWRYGLTPEELASAEAEPRVELVEGPAEGPTPLDALTSPAAEAASRAAWPEPF